MTTVHQTYNYIGLTAQQHDVVTYYAKQASDIGRALGLRYHTTSLTILVFW